MAGRRSLTPLWGRRQALLGLLALSACARVTHGALPEPFGDPVAAPALRVVIFEIRQPDLPFHAGLIIRQADEVMLFDPAGTWEPGHLQCERQGQVIRNLTPALEEAYLTRDGIGYLPDSWVTHVIDIPVSAAVARQAADLALAQGPVLPFHCAEAVSGLLARLPGFADIHENWITAELLRALVLRADVTYHRRGDAEAVAG